MAESRAGDARTGAVEAVLGALARYRERRALDGGGAECLLERIDIVEDEAERRRRRAELVDRAVEVQGLPRAFAEQVYDVAREEGLEPPFAFELVRCGVAVCEPAGAEAEAPSTVQGDPNWLVRLPPASAARRERRLRASFRRLRSLIDRCDTVEEALIAFAREPDVRECGY